MKTFGGRIVTVPDGAGRSVTVSNWGVAQSSRHRIFAFGNDPPPLFKLFQVSTLADNIL
jgi:hypothetical protein